MLCNIDASPIYLCVYREHFGEITHIQFGDGLSLCVQGTQDDESKSKAEARFIPVCTGNTYFL